MSKPNQSSDAYRDAMRRAAGLVVVVSAAAVVAGCTSPTPALSVRRIVEFSNLGVSGVDTNANSYTIVEREPSIGRFPAGIAIARIKLQGGVEELPHLELDPLLNHEAVYWNELFDSMPDVRETTLIDQPSVPQRIVTLPMLLKSAQRLRCRFLLVYGANVTSDASARAVGALYDTDTSALIGTLFAEVVIPPGADLEPPPTYPKGDKRYKDPSWLTARKLESLFREMIWELIGIDRPPGEPPAVAPAEPAPVTSQPAPTTAPTQGG